MDLATDQMASLIIGMRREFQGGGNAMAFARQHLAQLSGNANSALATLIAYDLQAGRYTEFYQNQPDTWDRWCRQAAEQINRVLPGEGTILEVGVGEATTLDGVIQHLGGAVAFALGFDISWSRINMGRAWLARSGRSARLFVADIGSIPLMDNSVDVVYTSHSLEPNGGRESLYLRECLRVARVAVVLIEPIYELASPEAQARMRHHGYVTGLRHAAETLGARVLEHRLLDFSLNPLNPSGVIILTKAPAAGQIPVDKRGQGVAWRCPLTGVSLAPHEDVFFAAEAGLVYPTIRGVPMLRAEHAVVASGLER